MGSDPQGAGRGIENDRNNEVDKRIRGNHGERGEKGGVPCWGST